MALRAGQPVPDGYWKDAATGKSALIGHSTDWFPGDGITDLIARMPDGKLYAYPGDGSGRFDISRPMNILMPAGSPDPATFTQLITNEDVTGDKIADVFAVTDTGTLWALNGYTEPASRLPSRSAAPTGPSATSSTSATSPETASPTSSSATTPPPAAASPCARASQAPRAAST
ncbi:hypothetical protein ACGFX2_15595 [Streptomyces goshikiensis]|uniref:hypothetical protein n=1 Tax=Streptomyces goshikiensis TaxID=1942 RepID=UPI00371BFD92